MIKEKEKLRKEYLVNAIALGILQQKREDVIEVLEVRFSVLPSELVEKINQIEDADPLKTWLYRT